MLPNYPMPVCLVGAIVDGKANFMAVAWFTISGFKPPSIAVCLNKERYTLKGILEHNSFSVCIPSMDLVKEVDFCGIHSGSKVDKSKVFKTFLGKTGVPLIEGCPVNVECTLKCTTDSGSHIILVGEIVQVHTEPGVKYDPIIYSEGSYYKIGERVAKAFDIGKNLP